MRPWSETANSTRSLRPPPRSERCASRTRFTLIHDHQATPRPTAPTATPAIATISAAVAVALQARIDDLHRAVDEVAGGLARVDRRVDDTLANAAIVRYDAYEDTGGHQSASVALLDSSRSGVVVTSIQGRDYARIYMKELERGKSSVALSPEEQEAVERAMGR